MSSNNNNNNQHDNNVCVGTIIDSEDGDAFNYPSRNATQVFQTTTANSHNGTLENQNPMMMMNNNHNNHTRTLGHHHQQQQQVVYATNPQTGQTVMFPYIPALSMPAPNHQRGSPTYEYHGSSSYPGQMMMLQQQHQQQQHAHAANGTTTATTIYAGELQEEEHQKPWSTDLFQCWDDSEGCLESWCCGRCQLSRQYNFMANGRKDIDLFSFFFSVFADVIAAPVGIWALTWYTRRAVRHRYQIIGNDCSDCCVAAFCGPCASHQQYRQMSIEGEWPTGCFINQPYALPAEKRLREQHRQQLQQQQQQQQRPGNNNNTTASPAGQPQVVGDASSQQQDGTSMV